MVKEAAVAGWSAGHSRVGKRALAPHQGRPRWTAPSLRPARRVDLLRGVTKGAKDPVVEACPSSLLEEMWADILPHDPAITGDLEDAAVTAFADQRVAVGEPLRPRNI